MLSRLFPRQIDNRLSGHRAALWLLGLLTALKLVVAVNSIFSTASIATGDGIALDSFGPAATRTVLMLFALSSVGDLTVAMIAIVVLIRYRAMVPFIYLMFIADYLAQRFVVQSYAVPHGAGNSFGWYLIWGILAVLTLGLALSLRPARQRNAMGSAVGPVREPGVPGEPG
jgi:hypothetical protein